MATVKGTAKADKLKVTESSIMLTAGKGNDTITVSGGKKSTVRGQDGNDTITVTAKVGTGNKIYGDAGVDTIKIQGGNSNYYYGGTGNDKITLSGGKSNTIHGDAGDDIITVMNGNSNIVYGDAGNDTFVVGSKGSFSIKDYTPNQDTLKISGGTVTKTALNGTNVVFTVGSANVTLEKASGKNISVKDSRGSHTVSNSTISLGSDFSGAMDSNAYLSTVKTIDGSAATKSINIIGNTQNNIIYAGKSGGTYQGKAGNDQYVINSTLDDSAIFTIDQTTANQTDTDTLVVNNLKWADTYVGISNGTLTLQNIAGGRIIIKSWDTNPIKQVQFADKTVSINDITTKASTQNVIHGLDGKPVLNGTVGKDLIYGDVATKSIYADDGDDKIIVGHNQIVYGGNGNDTITSKGAGTNVFYGGVGNDYIVVSGIGKNYLYGGDDADTLVVTLNTGEYFLYGGKEKDTYVANLSTLYSGTYSSGRIEIKNAEKAYTDEEYAALENAEANGYATYKTINSDREDTLVINSYSLDDFTFKLDKFDLVISRKYDIYAKNPKDYTTSADEGKYCPSFCSDELIRIKDWYVHPLESIQFADGTYTADEINNFMASTDYTWVQSGITYTAWGDSIRDEFLISNKPSNATIIGFGDNDILDFRYSFTKAQVQFAKKGDNLKIVCNDTDTFLTVKDFFKNNVSTAFAYFKPSYSSALITRENLISLI